MSVSIGLETRSVSRAALSGRDYRNINFELLCQPGDEIRAGAALMRDSRRPDIRFVAPVSGQVTTVERGARRRLISLQIDVDDTQPALVFAPPNAKDRDSIRKYLLQTGVWSSLRTRPFGNLPNPDAEPAAIFVTALDGEPGAPDSAMIIDAYIEEFRAAIGILASISNAPVYICHSNRHPLAIDNTDRVRCVGFADGYQQGLPGLHINRLCPIGFGGGEVWHLGYQDAIALGHLLLQGSPWLQRILQLNGNAVKRPRSLRVCPGAAIDDLIADELVDSSLRIVIGSAQYGRPRASGEVFLGSGQRQITALAAAVDAPSAGRRAGVLIPAERLESLAPPGIYPVPLMRALQLGDAERARELGALELGEEDLVPLSLACASNNDYGLLLREVLDQIEAER